MSHLKKKEVSDKLPLAEGATPVGLEIRIYIKKGIL
jgi:hypothetical protein